MEAWGITILRVAVGLPYIVHGGQKLFIHKMAKVTMMMKANGLPWPRVCAILVSTVEFFGGIALVLGFYTRLAAMPLSFTMVVALVAVKLKGGYFLPEGYEYVLLLLAASIALIFTGSGAFAIN
jgi:putative oxidoreductase